MYPCLLHSFESQWLIVNKSGDLGQTKFIRPCLDFESDTPRSWSDRCISVLPSSIRSNTWSTYLKDIHAWKNLTLLISQCPILLSWESHCQTVVPL